MIHFHSESDAGHIQRCPCLWGDGSGPAQRPAQSRADLPDKADLTHERAVLSAEAEKMAAYWGCRYFETSAVRLPSIFRIVARRLSMRFIAAAATAALVDLCSVLALRTGAERTV